MTTRAAFITDVLQDIGIVSISDSESPEDNAKAILKYQLVHSMLQTDDLLPFDDDDAIPNEYVQPMLIATASALMPVYGRQSDFESALEAARRMIRRINKDFSGSSTTPFRDF
jgi:hypothetical protein